MDDVLFSDPPPVVVAGVPREVTVSSPQFGQVTLADRLFTVQGMRIDLTKNEARLVRLLLEAEGSVVPLVQLKRVLGYHPEAKTHTVENHIYRIRERLRASAIEELIMGTAQVRKSTPVQERGYLVPVLTV
jgi:DNA-binding response OmpR family regulator